MAITEVPNRLHGYAGDGVAAGPADRFIFTRAEYAPPELDRSRLTIIPPSIDAFSPRNEDLPDGVVRAIVVRAGLVAGEPPSQAPVFTRARTAHRHASTGMSR